ncbi:MAG: metallophosphoesterase family protein [bacterium]
MDTRRRRAALLAVSALLLSGCALAPAPPGGARSGDRVVFAAIGDTPYNPPDEIALRRHLRALAGEEAAFLVHLGDIKPSGPNAPCVEAPYRKAAEILGASPKPVFIVPGDNEWNDCADPDRAWSHWSRHFLRFEERWGRRFGVRRQKGRPENFAFRLGGVLFVGINLVGDRVHDPAEWRRRHAGNLAWVRENFGRSRGVHSAVLFAQYGARSPAPVYWDFFNGLAGAARAFGRPILFLHGHFHFRLRQDGFLVPNMTRAMVASGSAPPEIITVTGDPAGPFRFARGRLPPIRVLGH